jgi:uncharacterized protein (DUF3084 family)
MVTLNPPLPAVPTDNALTYAMTLLAIAADPAGTKARMDELVGQITAVHAATAEHDAAAAKAAEVEARETAVAAKEQDVVSREAALTASQTQLQVASAAISDRDAAVTAKEAASDKREADITARQTALEQRIAGYRSALGA